MAEDTEEPRGVEPARMVVRTSARGYPIVVRRIVGGSPWPIE
jgi:hypothetical protein